jgi:radical SAM protein with 4Fe4S-binding SPASM domain
MSRHPHQNKPSEALVRQIIDFIVASHNPQANSLTIKFYGGEPLLNFEAIKTITTTIQELHRTKKITPKPSFSITTNLTLATTDILNFLIEHHYGMMISLDGKRATNDQGRGERVFDKVIHNLSYLQAKNAAMELSMTVTPHNIAKFRENWEFINSLGIPFLWKPDCSQSYSPETLEKLVNDLHACYAKPRNKIHDTSFVRISHKRQKKTHCIDPTTLATIDPQGSLLICNRVNDIIGDIWVGYDEKKILAAENAVPLFGNFIHPECPGCPSYDICKGGCYGVHLEHEEQSEMMHSTYTLNKTYCTFQHVYNVFLNESKLYHLLEGNA